MDEFLSSFYYYCEFIVVTLFKPLLANVPILYLLKTTENHWFFGIKHWPEMV